MSANPKLYRQFEIPFSSMEEAQKAQTCAWHIYRESCSVDDSAPFKVDTSEGHLMDAGDRMFWDRVYKSMSMSDPEPEDSGAR